MHPWADQFRSHKDAEMAWERTRIPAIANSGCQGFTYISYYASGGSYAALAHRVSFWTITAFALYTALVCDSDLMLKFLHICLLPQEMEQVFRWTDTPCQGVLQKICVDRVLVTLKRKLSGELHTLLYHESEPGGISCIENNAIFHRKRRYLCIFKKNKYYFKKWTLGSNPCLQRNEGFPKTHLHFRHTIGVFPDYVANLAIRDSDFYCAPRDSRRFGECVASLFARFAIRPTLAGSGRRLCDSVYETTPL